MLQKRKPARARENVAGAKCRYISVKGTGATGCTDVMVLPPLELDCVGFATCCHVAIKELALVAPLELIDMLVNLQ